MQNLNQWTRTVKQRDGYFCRKCGITTNLHAHHIMPKGKYPEFELELVNGVTLCGNCHTLLKGQEEEEDLRGFLPSDAEIGKQLASLVELMELKLESAMTELLELSRKLQFAAGANSPESSKILDNLNRVHERIARYKDALDNLSKPEVINSERTESTVISEIRLDYDDEDGIYRTLTKRIYETWNPELEQWHLKKIEYLFDGTELPVSSDNIEAAAHTRDGRLIPSEWIFIAQKFVYTRKPIEVKQRGHTYDHDG